MKALARLLARHLLEAEPDEVAPEPAPEPARPPVDARDFILDIDNVLVGVPEPDFYIGLEDKLGGREKVQVDGNLFLVRLEGGQIAYRLHMTDIIRVNRDGLAMITTYGRPNPKHGETHFYRPREGYGYQSRSWRTNLTRWALNKHLPCGWSIYTRTGAWHWANQASRTGYYDGPNVRILFNDGDKIDTKSGTLMPQDQPANVRKRPGTNTRGYVPGYAW